jgi:hypothetical protein
MESKYLHYFYDAKSHLENNSLRTIKNHISNYENLEELLGYQYYLNTQCGNYYYNTDVEILKKNMVGLSAHLLFSYNVQSLQSTLYSLECNLIHSSANNLRTVQEAIPKMYYISLSPEEIGKILVHEEIHMMKYEEAVKTLQGEDCQTYLNGEELEFLTKNDFYEFKRKYMPNSFRDKLYDEERKNGLDRLYGKLSNSSHANITRNRTSVEYDYQNMEIFFEFLHSLSYFNIESYLESNFDLLYHLNLIKESQDFLNKMANAFGTIMSDVYFIPNKGELPSRLKLKPISR